MLGDQVQLKSAAYFFLPAVEFGLSLELVFSHLIDIYMLGT